MPKDSVNFYLSIQSGSSEHTLTSLTDKTRALDKETQLLQQATEGLAKANKPLVQEQTRLQSQLKTSQETVNDAQKAFDEYGDEISKLKLDQAIENHAKLKQELNEVNAQLNTNQKTYKEYLETVRKGKLSDPGGSGLGGGDSGATDLSAVWGGLGIGEQLSSMVTQTSGALLSSALGDGMGGMISGSLGSAISGAALGTAIAPGIGTAVGAVLGGLSGLASGAIEKWENQNEAFKDYYGGLYEDVKGRSGEMVESGSTIAGGREQTRMAFSQRLGGDAKADAYLAKVEKMAANTNYEYDEIVGYAKLLLNSYDPSDVFGVLQTLSDATAGLNLNSSDINTMISGLSRMRTLGKATQEYLNYFRERGVDVDQALSDSLGVKKSSISGLVTKGKISGEDAAQAILDFIQGEFGGLSNTLAGTYDAMVDNLGDIYATLNAQGGDTYNTLRKEGIQAEMNALDGTLGDALVEINRVLGENQARKENMQEQYMREVLDTVLNGTHGELWGTFSEDQQEALSKLSQELANWSQKYEESGRTDEEAGAKIESLYEYAQVLGQAYFDNSDFMQILNDTELDEIEAIMEATAGLSENALATYKLTQALSKGLPVDMKVVFAGGSNTLTQQQMIFDHYIGKRHAYGLERVPYDDYPALLHEGERVLTASEARAADAGQSGTAPIQVTITGNYFTGLPEEMADQLAEILVRKLARAATAAAPK